MADWNSYSVAEKLMDLCEQQQEEIQQLSEENSKLRSTLREMLSALEECRVEILRLREELEKPTDLRSRCAARSSMNCSSWGIMLRAASRRTKRRFAPPTSGRKKCWKN